MVVDMIVSILHNSGNILKYHVFEYHNDKDYDSEHVFLLCENLIMFYFV